MSQRIITEKVSTEEVKLKKSLLKKKKTQKVSTEKMKIKKSGFERTTNNLQPNRRSSDSHNFPRPTQLCTTDLSKQVTYDLHLC